MHGFHILLGVSVVGYAHTTAACQSAAPVSPTPANACSHRVDLSRARMTLETLLNAKRDEILHLCAKYGARNVRVFGSVARGEADEQSDIDFLVELEPGRTLFDLGGLQYDLEQLLRCRVDVVTERGLKPRIRERALREAVSLCCKGRSLLPRR